MGTEPNQFSFDAAAGMLAPDAPVDVDADEPKKKNHYRTIFLSDIHLGTKGCQADFLLDFIRHHECDTLYLVGDIVDCWSLTRSWYWPQAHNDVVQKLLRLARKGTRVIYIPGNHDEPLRNYTNLQAGGVEIEREVIHRAADGKRYLVIHGDEFDGVVRYAKWLAVLGDRSYQFLMAVNHWVNRVRHLLGKPYWSLSAAIKHKVKEAVAFMSNYEDAVSGEAKSRGLDGVICGHIHHAEIKPMNDIIYMNDGDWVESCTALVETMTGEFEIIRWTRIDHQPSRAKAKARDRARVKHQAEMEA